MGACYVDNINLIYKIVSSDNSIVIIDGIKIKNLGDADAAFGISKGALYRILNKKQKNQCGAHGRTYQFFDKNDNLLFDSITKGSIKPSKKEKKNIYLNGKLRDRIITITKEFSNNTIINMSFNEMDTIRIFSFKYADFSKAKIYSAIFESFTEIYSHNTVYLLLGKEIKTGRPAIYVGESTNQSDRVYQHKDKNCIWEDGIVITAMGDPQTHNVLDSDTILWLENKIAESINENKYVNKTDKTDKNKLSNATREKILKVIFEILESLRIYLK